MYVSRAFLRRRELKLTNGGETVLSVGQRRFTGQRSRMAHNAACPAKLIERNFRSGEHL